MCNPRVVLKNTGVGSDLYIEKGEWSSCDESDDEPEWEHACATVAMGF